MARMQMPRTVVSIRIPVVSRLIVVVSTSSSSSAPSGTMTVRNNPTGRARALPRRLSLCCNSVSRTRMVGSPTAMITDQ